MSDKDSPEHDWRLAHSKWRPGEVVGERYRLVCPIGFGATAEVWRAEHVQLHSSVALKLLAELPKHQMAEVRGRFTREARAVVQLRSPHIVQVFDLRVEDECAYMAMELLEGETLLERLGRTSKLTPAETARIVAQLAAGLQVAHEAGIIHRDIKPSNIFLANDRDREIVKLVDFGIAKRTLYEGVDQLATQQGVVVGTPSYASPEQVLANVELDTRSDLWQVAVVTYECLCGKRPFDAGSLGQLMISIAFGEAPAPSTVADVPAGFDEWFKRATARDPAARFQTAEALAEALCFVLTPDTTAADLVEHRPSWAPPPPAAPPEPDEVPTVPVDDVDEPQIDVRTSMDETFDIPDLRPRGRRKLLLLAGAAALVIVGALLYSETESAQQQGNAALDNDGSTGAAAAPAVSEQPHAAAIDAADAGADAESPNSASSGGDRPPRPRPYYFRSPPTPPRKNPAAGSRKAEEELGI